MFHAFSRLMLGLVVMFLAVVGGQAQPPDWPPINPAAARLDSTIAGLDGPGLAIVYSEPVGMLAVACEDQHIRWWPKDVVLGIRPGKRPANELHGHQGPVTTLAWGGGPVLGSASADRKLVLWSVAEGKPLHTIATPHFLRALALSPDGKVLASAGDDPAVQLWDVAEGKPTRQLRDHTDWLLCLAFSPDGKFLASGGHDPVIRLWDVSAGTKIRTITGQPEPPPKDPPPIPQATALTFSPDSKQLLIGRADGTIEQVNVADGKLIRKLPGHGSTITGLVLHPTGNLLVSSSKDRTVRLWNPANGQAIKTLEGHTAWVQGVVFVARGTRLASVGADRTVRLWDLTEPPKK